MAKRRTKRTAKEPPSTVDNSNDSEQQRQVEKQLLELSAREVEHRVTAIQAIRDAENEHLLTRLRLLRSYFTEDQLKIPAVQFFKENLPNLSVIFNEDGEIELEWNAKTTNMPVNDDAEWNMHGPNSGFEFSSKAVKMSFVEGASLHVPDFEPLLGAMVKGWAVQRDCEFKFGEQPLRAKCRRVHDMANRLWLQYFKCVLHNTYRCRLIVFEDPSETLKLGFQANLQTPGATSQRLSVGVTPKTKRLPKNGEILLSVHGSPLGVFKEDNMEAIHELEEG